MSGEKPNLENFTLLLYFMKGDSRIPDALRWGFSIKAKVRAVRILYEEVLSQIPKCFDEIKAIEKEGISDAIQCSILAIKYEVFLNSIYALCENLSNVVWHLHGRRLPRRFREQKKRLLASNSPDSNYAKILEQTEWYNEVNAMRTEATHFLSGMIAIHSPTELGYYNLPKDQRQGTPEKIQIADVEKHVKEIYQSVLAFLSEFGNHFIAVINQDCRVAKICCVIPRVGIGAKMISLREYLNDQAGICQTTAFDCPEKNSCKARKK